MTNTWTRLASAADFLGRGGIINAIIGALYLVVVVAAAERAVYFVRTGYRRPAFLAGLSRLAEAAAADDGRAAAFPWPARYARSQAVRLVRVALRERGRSRHALDEVLGREGSLLRTEMGRGLETLSVIGAGAPLLGLLGTVTGLMAAFGRMEALGGAVDIAALSGGIWEAMITTATGLGAAIPAVAAGRVFERIVELRLRDMAYAASTMAEALSGEADEPAAAPRPGSLESA